MQLLCILAISITTLSIWSDPKSVAAECFRSSTIAANCTYHCYDEPLAFVIESVTSIWNEYHETCKESGMSLVLNNIDFPNSTLYKKWFNSEIILNYLDINLTNVDKIEVDAFDSKPFSTVEELNVKTSLKFLEIGTFNGFTSLTTLTLSFAILPELIEANLLIVPSASLKKCRIFGGGKDFTNPRDNILELDNITGSGALSSLVELSVEIPLNDSITRRSFVGLTNIVKIDLEFCQITAIGRGSFDSIGPNLTSLILKNNKITTLPGDLFKRILMNSNLKIDLAKNQWHCDCHLINFQKYLIDYGENFDKNLITCASPSNKEFYAVAFTTIEQDDQCAYAKECYSDLTQRNIFGTVYIDVPSASISLVPTDTGDLVISSEAMSNAPRFIYHSRKEPYNDAKDEDINCIEGLNATIQRILLTESVPYTFCYLEDGMETTSLFNCITYIKIGAGGELKILYSEESKANVIALVIASLFLSLLFGIVVGMQFIKIKQRVIHYVYNNTTTMNKMDIEVSTIPPPLPVRPKSIVEKDPVYTYVG